MPRKPNKTGRMPLSRRLANDIKLDIIRGRYKPGSVLPPIRELVGARGKSAKVPRRALDILENEGWTRPVRGVGSIVLDRGDDGPANGRVLVYARQTGYSYFCSALLSVIDTRLLSKGYKTFVVNATGRGEGAACRQFEARLREKWSLVAMIGGGEEARRIAANSGRPFILIGNGAPLPQCSSASCVGRIEIGSGLALSEFKKACVRRGVRRVVQFKYITGSFDAAETLAAAEIATETIGFRREPNPEAVARAALAQMRKIAEKGALPDLFLFTDDYLAQGALIALGAAGIRIPEDVKVATLANKGLGPIWVKPLARLEIDPVAHGRAVADAILAFLETGGTIPPLVLGSVWKNGVTL